MLSLSVITITYKDAAGLQKTVDSLKPLLKSDIPWEHVIVDSSPELNESVISALPPDWPLKHVKSQPAGIYPAMNLGLQKAAKDCVWFLNGGDEVAALPHLANNLIWLEKEPGLSGVYGAAALFEGGKYLYSIKPQGSFEKYLVGMNRVCHQGVIYKKAVFEKLGEYLIKYKLASDYEFNLRASLSGLKFKCVDGVFVKYDTGGASSNYRAAMDEFKQIISELKNKMPFSKWLLFEAAWKAYSIKIPVSKFLKLRALRS